ncbi:MAG TPA: acyl transferase [Chryseolinea sp.]|nr:acyl transferase [Chryseolinea sp.]HPM32172.1 acyl transferase [Chryseolinea sp.]
MDTFKGFQSKLYSLNEYSFEAIALDVFRVQAVYNPVYKEFLQHLSIMPASVQSVRQIPFLPISFFKTHLIKTGIWEEETYFSSSGTTGSTTSKHIIRDEKFYLRHAQKNFEMFFGPLTDYHFLVMLPSYQEREGSSLIAMMQYFITESKSDHSAFYLYNQDQLVEDIRSLQSDNRKIILWGVSFALLDLVEKYDIDLGNSLVFETGGMKGRRKEMTRAELHQTLKDGLNVSTIYSEYGMTELLSQAYAVYSERFSVPPWMKVIGRELSDPFHKGLLEESAGINVIDLANWNSISFIETEDIGKVYTDGTFEVLGRMDNSDVRGCNLMVE